MEQKQVSESEKILKAMIEASVMVNPSLENKLTVAAAWQYLQLPDSTFGWNAVDREKGVSQPMPIQFKVACLIPTIVNGLLPGHVIWMGNKPYATSGAFSHVVNRDVVKLSGIRYRPFTAEEKEMFCIGEKDMAVVAEQRVRIRDVELDWAGYGVLGADEMQANKWGNYKVATQLVRDKMQFVRTRAIRDMHSRNYPISGLSEADEVSFVEDVSPAAPSSPVQAPTLIEAPKAEPIRDLHAAITRFEGLCQRVMSAGGEPLVILGVDKVELLQDAGKLDAASDVLEDWLAEDLLKPKGMPILEVKQKSEPAPEAASANPAPATGKKRGRKSKAELEAIAAAKAAEELTSPATALPDPEIPEECEESEGEAAETPPTDDLAFLDEAVEYDESEDVFAETANEDFPDAFAEPEIYAATEAQKSILRAAAAEAGLTGNGVLHTLSGAMNGRPMSELPTKIQAILKLHQKPAPAPSNQVDLKPLQDARQRLKDAVEYVTKTGGAPMHILGVNPHNLLAGGTAEAMNQAAETLEEWKPKPPVTTLPEKLEVPSEGPGLAAYKLLGTAFGNPSVNLMTKAKIAELARRKLRNGDSAFLPKAIRLANEGKFSEIDQFISSREMRA